MRPQPHPMLFRSTHYYRRPALIRFCANVLSNTVSTMVIQTAAHLLCVVDIFSAVIARNSIRRQTSVTCVALDNLRGACNYFATAFKGCLACVAAFSPSSATVNLPPVTCRHGHIPHRCAFADRGVLAYPEREDAA